MTIANLENIGWIPLSVAMPCMGTGCIVTDGENTAYNSMHVITNGPSSYMIQWKSNNNLWNPTHWMPLPKIK